MIVYCSLLTGCGSFVAILVYIIFQSEHYVQWQDKAVQSAFFVGAVLCLGFSCLFHTLYCHSEAIGKLFNKLDYCGIAVLTMGSFVPYLYYSFYCSFWPKIIYLLLIIALGTAAIVVSMFDKFASPPYRPLRAGVFIGLGLSGLIPCIHYCWFEGFWSSVENASLGWLILMALLYIGGAIIYAVRIPERLFPGRFDLWVPTHFLIFSSAGFSISNAYNICTFGLNNIFKCFQSHQIFHVFVVAAAFVHYHGIVKIADF
ncbi:unnamed protein product, partial [Protopolystoma xenopodis]